MCVPRLPRLPDRRHTAAHEVMEHEVIVPSGADPGTEVLIEVDGTEYCVTVPEGCHEGSTFSVTLLAAFVDTPADDDLIEVIVPEGCLAGERFCVQLDGGEFVAIVPEGCGPGSAVLLTVPKQQLPESPPSRLGHIAASASAGVVPDELSGSSDTDGEDGPTFPIGLPVEVRRTDGEWTLVTVTEYDADGDTYTVRLVDGRFKYFVEASDLRLPAFLLKTNAMI